MGFHTKHTDWIFFYLSKRITFVCYNCAISDIFTNTSGVPRGSNLGLLLIIIFINSLTGLKEGKNVSFFFTACFKKCT